MPMAFTEQGVAMLSSVLNSKTAIEVNIRVIRVFTKLREYALTHKEILLQLSRLEKEVKGNSQDIENIFSVLKELIEKHSNHSPRNKIGYKRLRRRRNIIRGYAVSTGIQSTNSPYTNIAIGGHQPAPFLCLPPDERPGYCVLASGCL